MLLKFVHSEDSENYSQELLDDIIKKNTIAIAFPYSRSYVSNLSSMTTMGTAYIPIFYVGKALAL